MERPEVPGNYRLTGPTAHSAQRADNQEVRVRVLVFADYFLPGFKAGGPIRSLVGLMHHLGHRFSFSILTSDRDLGDDEPYSGVVLNRWHCLGGARCLYLEPWARRPWRLPTYLKTAEWDLLYLNSIFSLGFTVSPLVMRRLGLLPKIPAILAPRGELHAGALKLKRLRKVLFLTLARAIGMYSDLVWHATDSEEVKQIQAWFGQGAMIELIPNLTAVRTSHNPRPRAPKTTGKLRVVFLSRVGPKKNLHKALEILGGVESSITFDIFGPIEDRAYWRRCVAASRHLPSNVTVKYKGPLAHSQVTEVLSQYDLLFLPTAGENFGHVVLEALVSGCPVLTSDQTPWRDLERAAAGYDLPLERPDGFRRVLESYATMTESQHARWREGAARLGARSVSQQDKEELYADLFEKVARGTLYGQGIFAVHSSQR